MHEFIESNLKKKRYLTGNPCTDFDGYRDYVIATLPQLKVNIKFNMFFIIIFSCSIYTLSISLK